MDQDESAADQRAIVLALDGETHTLGNTLRDVMWSHPHIELASYTQEHPSVNEIILRCQTNAAIPAEQGVVEALHITKAILSHMGDTMAEAAKRWEEQHGGGGDGGQRRQQRQQRQGDGAAAMNEDS
ncbi:hypothetical protein ABPG75_001965 [Micractinium tetrahymenae]